MINQIQDLQNKIFSKEKESDELDSWVYLMLNFGWIPFDEYLELDTEILNRLLNITKIMTKPKSPRGKLHGR